MNASDAPPFFILTGPPGSGKSTLLDAVSSAVSTVPEAARRVLAIQRHTGETATGEQDPAAFIRTMKDMMLADYRSASGHTLFDRGLPDLLAFCGYYQCADTEIRQKIKSTRYQPSVLFLPAWREIYQQDQDRKLNFEGAAAFGERTREAYRQSGYRLVELPKASLSDRKAFVLDHISA